MPFTLLVSSPSWFRRPDLEGPVVWGLEGHFKEKTTPGPGSSHLAHEMRSPEGGMAARRHRPKLGCTRAL